MGISGGIFVLDSDPDVEGLDSQLKVAKSLLQDALRVLDELQMHLPAAKVADAIDSLQLID